MSAYFPTDAAPTPDQTAARFNWPAALKGCLIAFCLIGISDRTGDQLLLALAAVIVVYLLAVEIPVWRLVTIDRCRRTGRKVVSWIPRLAAFAVALKLAVVLADGPYVVGYIGSLFFIAVLLAGAVLLAIALCRLAVAAGQRAATASSAILPRVRFYLALAWLAISK